MSCRGGLCPGFVAIVTRCSTEPHGRGAYLSQVIVGPISPFSGRTLEFVYKRTGGFTMGFRRGIGIIIGLVVFSLFVGSSHAQQGTRTITFESTNTTTFFSAPFNFDGPGVANYAVYAGQSKLGNITGQGVSQSAFTSDPPTPCKLPDGTDGVALALVHHVAVTRFEGEGDLLYEEGKPGDLKACLNFQTGVFFESGRVTITGGTGRFKGATGFYDAVQNGQILVPSPTSPSTPPDPSDPAPVNPNGGLQFGFATATYTYTLNTLFTIR